MAAKNRPAVKTPDYQVVEDLVRDLTDVIAKYKQIYPSMDLTLGVKALILTEQGDQKITVQVKDTPAYEQPPLPIFSESDMDKTYKDRLKEWKRMQEEQKDDGDES